MPSGLGTYRKADALSGLNDLDIFSFDDVLPLAVTAGKTDPDDIPKTPKKPITRKGDLWVLGSHRIVCGVSETDFVRLMPTDDVKGGIVLTDPPYGINIVKGGKTSRDGKGTVGMRRRALPRRYAPVEGDDKTFDPTWLLVTGKAQIVFGAQFFASRLVDQTAWICWDKGTMQGAPFSEFELAWTSFKGRARLYRHTWSGMVRAGPRNEELTDRIHPTQKPVGLMKQILDDIGTGYDLVLDPYLGSGSVLIACEILKRRCYAMEIAPEYVDLSVKRWEDFTGLKGKRHGR